MKVLGLMSGTSLDGLDICIADFDMDSMSFQMGPCTTIPYDDRWKSRLSEAMHLHEDDLYVLNQEYASWLALQCNIWLAIHDIQVEIIASHGHTIVHRPEKGITFQLGNHQKLADLTSIPVVCDFRVQDVQLGGQGAPLVPIGDQLLFHSYRSCLNLGGFSNISYNLDEKRIAFDISPCNLILNRMVNQQGLEYDDGGELSRKGVVIESLLNELSAILFFKKKPPKSLSRVWMEKTYQPILGKYKEQKLHDLLHTLVVHIGQEIGSKIPDDGPCLVTGGGVYHSFLMEKIQENTEAKIIIPDYQIIEFKEALIFGLLGALRWNDKINVLSSVTGAEKDHSSGYIFHPSI